jgi:hypothetical protein
MSDGVGIVSAFITGVAVCTLSGFVYHGVTRAIKRYYSATKTMAVRNK